MSAILRLLASSGGIALLSSTAFAASSSEKSLTTVTELFVLAFLICAAIVAVLVYFAKFRDRRNVALETLSPERREIHSVAPSATIIECVRTMSTKKIGAIIVIDREKLVGIFTERDALNKVLAAGLDPAKTRVADVMTRDPVSVPPSTTVGEAMELITRRRFRHLPVVQNGKVHSVISSGDLTHWLVKDRVGDVQTLVDLAAKS